MTRILYCLLLCLLCSACRMGKEYRRPPADMPAAFRGDKGQPDSTDLSWRSFFADHKLRDLIDSVLLHNYDMAAAVNVIRMNSEYLKQARLAWSPAVSVNAGTGSNYFSENSLNGARGFNLDRMIGIRHIDDYMVNTGLSWEAGIWGKVKNQKKEAMATWLQSREARLVVQTRLIASTASAYYNILMLHQQLAIAAANLALSDSIVGIIGMQLEHGAATSLALEQAEVQRKGTQALIPDLEEALFIEENALRVLMAGAPAAIPVTSEQPAFEVPARFPAGVPVALLGNRPDIRQKEYELIAAHARTGIARAALYPSLNITAAGGLNAFQAANWISLPASLFGTFAAGLAQPVLNRRRLKTSFRVSKIAYEQKVNEFRKAVLQATAEVADNLQRSARLEEKIAIAKSKNDLLLRAISDAGLLFHNGMADYLEVIAVQQNLLQSQLSLSLLKKQQAVTYVELFRSLGGGTDERGRAW